MTNKLEKLELLDDESNVEHIYDTAYEHIPSQSSPVRVRHPSVGCRGLSATNSQIKMQLEGELKSEICQGQFENCSACVRRDEASST
jgi:hypothetical protein